MENVRQVKVTVMADHYFTIPNTLSDKEAIGIANTRIDEMTDPGYIEQEIIHSEVIPYDSTLDFRCLDCNSEDGPTGYIVTNELWASAGCKPEDRLCKPCFEKRIGRPLAFEDYTVCPLNLEFVEGFEEYMNTRFGGKQEAPANAELSRVKDNLREPILDFCREFLNRTFHMADLLKYLSAQGLKFAPASPQRILQVLKKNGEINYTVLSRSDSLYRVLPSVA